MSDGFCLIEKGWPNEKGEDFLLNFLFPAILQIEVNI